MKELIDKLLELQELQWWLKHPTVKSFFLRSGCYSTPQNNSFSFYIKTENDDYDLTEELTDDFLVKVTYYPIDINKMQSKRVYRPYPTDTEIQARINTILSTFGGVSVTQTLGNITDSFVTGLVIGDL